MKNGVAVLLVLIVALVPVVAGQSGRVRNKNKTAEGEQDPNTIRLRVEEVLLPVSVRSDTGRLPGHLDPSDFLISEDGERREVTAVLRTPPSLLLILDTSGEETTVKHTNINREIAFRLIDALGERDQAAIITYADKVSLISDWTGDKQQLRHALNWEFKPGLKSHLYESLKFAAEEVLPRTNGRRVVVLVTDGVENDRSSLFNDALAAMHRARATVYVLSHAAYILSEIKPRAYNPLSWFEKLDPQARKRIARLRNYARLLEAGDTMMIKLAEETGGAVWNPQIRIECKEDEKLFSHNGSSSEGSNGPLDCEEVTDRMVEEIGTQYIVAYLSERRAGDKEFHPVKVFVTRRDLKARTRRGVYSNLP
ncbi:MAG TPA: VWA domain-containing protein [Blastocatellia bacterium]|nr:VWA domain-containing protein [Blastocatellia bacterium]